MVDQQRRGLVGGVLAVLGAAAVDTVLSGIPTAQAQTPRVDSQGFIRPKTVPRGSHAAFGDALKATSRAHEGRSKPGTICFGVRDSNHLEAAHKDPLLDPHNLETAKATGYGILSIELPTGLQPYAKRLWESGGTGYDLTVFTGDYMRFMRDELKEFVDTGRITEGDIKFNGFTVAEMQTWGSVIIAAKKAGIPVYMNDAQPAREIIQNLLDIETMSKNPNAATIAKVAENWEKRLSYDEKASDMIIQQMGQHKTNALHFGGEIHYRLRAGDVLRPGGTAIRNLDDALRQKGVTTPTLYVMAKGNPKDFHESQGYLKEHGAGPYPAHPSQLPDMYYSVGEAALHIADPVKYQPPQEMRPKSDISPPKVTPR